MTQFRYLSFLTDYGLDDGFVAACHGVGARLAPHAGRAGIDHRGTAKLFGNHAFRLRQGHGTIV